MGPRGGMSDAANENVCKNKSVPACLLERANPPPPTLPNAGEGAGQWGGGAGEAGWPPWKTARRVLTKLNPLSRYHPARLLGPCPEELKTGPRENLRTAVASSLLVPAEVQEAADALRGRGDTFLWSIRTTGCYPVRRRSVPSSREKTRRKRNADD